MKLLKKYLIFGATIATAFVFIFTPFRQANAEEYLLDSSNIKLTIDGLKDSYGTEEEILLSFNTEYNNPSSPTKFIFVRVFIKNANGVIIGDTNQVIEGWTSSINDCSFYGGDGESYCAENVGTQQIVSYSIVKSLLGSLPRGFYKIYINTAVNSEAISASGAVTQAIEIPFELTSNETEGRSHTLSVVSCTNTTDPFCPATISWSIKNAVYGEYSLETDYPDNGTIISNEKSGSVSYVFGPNDKNLLQLYDGVDLLEQKYIPNGNLTATPASCVISENASTCSASLSWSVTNPVPASSVAVTVDPNGDIVGTGNSGTTSRNISYGGDKFYLYNNNILLDNLTITASCATGTTWNGVKCAGPTTGDLTATPASCVISENASTCSASLSWSVANPIPTAFTRVTTDTNIVVGDGLSGTASYGVSYGSRRFYLYHNEVELDQVSVNASCATGTTWDGAKCVGEVAVEKKVELSLVNATTNIGIPTSLGGFMSKVQDVFSPSSGLRNSEPVKAGTPVRIEWVATGFNPDTIRCTMPDGSPRYQESGYYAITPNSTTTFEITCEDGTTVGEELEETPPYASSQCVGSPGEAEPGLTPETGVYICVDDQSFAGKWGGTWASEITGICVIGENMSSCNSGISFAVTGSGTESDGKTNQVIKYGGALGTQTVITTSEASSGGDSVLFNLPYSSSPISFGLFHGTDRYLLLEDFRTVCIKGTSWDTNQGKCIAY